MTSPSKPFKVSDLVETTVSGASRPGAAEHALEPGQRIAGRYRVERVVGSGAVGTVYAARDERDGAVVAVKLLHEGVAEGSENARRFDREAKVASSIDHPGAVRVTDHGLAETGAPYLAMELLEGESLEDRVDRDVWLPLGEACAIAEGLLDVLAALHRRGALHRDLKPSNVFLCSSSHAPEPQVKLLDFGLSRWLDPNATQLTKHGQLLGTPLYMPPEQVRGEVLDYRADLYSVGAMLYEMLSGRLPIEPQDDNVAQLLIKVLHEDPPPLHTQRLGIPPRLSELVHRALARSADDRFSSATEMRDALCEIRRELEPELGRMASAPDAPDVEAARPTLPTGLTVAAAAPPSGTEGEDRPAPARSGRRPRFDTPAEGEDDADDALARGIDRPRRSSVPDLAELDEAAAVGRLGKYELVEPLAQGGMAEIFLARDRALAGASRYVVVKRIREDLCEDDKFVRMFLDEARLATQLSHRSICHTYDVGEQDGSYYIAMEWVHGVPLERLLRRARAAGGVPAAVGVKIISHVAEALHYAHRARSVDGKRLGIVHRDVTPSNIMVSFEGAVKLLDFGIAKATTHALQTQAGVMKGKYGYMSPEQCLGQPLDMRSDIFALGVCLYEVLTGESLYRRDSAYATMIAVVEDAPRPVAGRVPHADAELEAILHKALAKDAEDRFADAGELHEALERWLAARGGLVTSGRMGDFVQRLYGDDADGSPLPDYGLGSSRSQRTEATERIATAPAGNATVDATQMARPRRRATLVMAVSAAVTLALTLAAGWWLLGGG